MSGILLNEHGQATPLSIALVLSSIVLAPMVSSRVGARVMMVLTAAMPTAYVWLLPVASKLGFANSMLVLMSHGEADVVGVITTPQATGWMVALYAMPLFALLRIANVGGRFEPSMAALSAALSAKPPSSRFSRRCLADEALGMTATPWSRAQRSSTCAFERPCRRASR